MSYYSTADRSRFSSQLLELNVTVPQQLWFHVSITTYPAMAEQGQKVTVGRGEGHVFGEKRTPNWDANNGRRMGKASFESLSGRAMVVLDVDAHQVANAKTQHAKAVIEAPAILVRHVTAASEGLAGGCVACCVNRNADTATALRFR